MAEFAPALAPPAAAAPAPRAAPRGLVAAVGIFGNVAQMLRLVRKLFLRPAVLLGYLNPLSSSSRVSETSKA
jgi:hypothetical protein